MHAHNCPTAGTVGYQVYRYFPLPPALLACTMWYLCTLHSLFGTLIIMSTPMSLLPQLTLRISETTLHRPFLIIHITASTLQKNPPLGSSLNSRKCPLRILKFNIPKPLQLLRRIIPGETNSPLYNLSARSTRERAVISEGFPNIHQEFSRCSFPPRWWRF